MGKVNGFDRAVCRFVNATGLWALDTPLEPLATGRRRVEPATDDEVTPASLKAMESMLREIVAGMRNWILVGVLLIVAGPAMLLIDWDPLTLVGFVVLLLALLAWTAWMVAMILKWRVQPVYGLADRITVAIKRRQLGDQAIASILAMPDDSLLLMSFQPLIRRAS